jgi:ABC-type dipeptide/oligopeptide/nickel transport system permease component
MIKYIVRRILLAIPVLFGLSLILFAFIHLMPGDPAATILGQHARPDLVEALRQRLGLDRPIPVQYVEYLGQLLRGDLGYSLVNNQSVIDGFLQRFPATIELTVAALLVAAGLGIPLGRFAARRPQSAADATATVVSLVGISIPVFVLGLTLGYIFGVQLQWLPASGRLDPRLQFESITGFLLLDSLLAARPDVFVDAARHLVLPAIVLATWPLAIITRITRASVLDVNNEDYVRTARAKGLSEGRVQDRHIMRNAWLPVVTVIGLTVGSLLGGAVITETVFAWTGVGKWMVEAVRSHDYFVIQNTILILAVIFLMVNLIVDILYAFLNPRIRYT